MIVFVSIAVLWAVATFAWMMVGREGIKSSWLGIAALLTFVMFVRLTVVIPDEPGGGASEPAMPVASVNYPDQDIREPDSRVPAPEVPSSVVTLAAPSDNQERLTNEIQQLRSLLDQQTRFITNLSIHDLFKNEEFLEIQEPGVRARVIEWVEKYDLNILPGDVCWLAERTRLGDWNQFADTSTEAVGIRFNKELE